MSDARVLTRKADYVGRVVRLLVPVENGLGIVPAGTKGEVKGLNPPGLRIVFDPCRHCGVRMIATHVRYDHVEIVE